MNRPLPHGLENALIFQLGRFPIYLTHGHLLPQFLNGFPLYDKFLPFMAAHLGSNEWIIDVGANCGDTLALMATNNTRSSYLCIEGDPDFFRLLEYNAQTLRLDSPELTVLTTRQMVGTNRLSGELVGDRGTKTFVETKDLPEHLRSDQATRLTLDEIITSHPDTAKMRTSLEQGATIRLLKTDVDFFDYDVIESAEKILVKERPLVFYECQFSNQSHIDNYLHLMQTLKKMGYVAFYVFDNFGGYLLKTKATLIIHNLMDYVQNQHLKHATRTIYQFDILACTINDEAFVDTMISSFTRWMRDLPSE